MTEQRSEIISVENRNNRLTSWSKHRWLVEKVGVAKIPPSKSLPPRLKKSGSTHHVHRRLHRPCRLHRPLFALPSPSIVCIYGAPETKAKNKEGKSRVWIYGAPETKAKRKSTNLKCFWSLSFKIRLQKCCFWSLSSKIRLQKCLSLKLRLQKSTFIPYNYKNATAFIFCFLFYK